MSAVAVGGLVPVDGPLPRERLHSLLTVPGVLVPQDELEPHWKSGIVHYGYPEGTPGLWEGCSDGTFRVKEAAGEVPIAEFVSFVLYATIECSALGIGNPAEFAERARDLLRVTQAFAMEEALATGIVGLDNPSFRTEATVLTGAAVAAKVGISYLEQAISETGRGGIIHITPAVAAALLPIHENPTAPMFTTAGTPISIGQGYIGTQIDGQAATTATQDWIFATGPVQVRLEDDVELMPDDIALTLDRANNDVVYRAEKVGVVSWDTALTAAALVNWAA